MRLFSTWNIHYFPRPVLNFFCCSCFFFTFTFCFIMCHCCTLSFYLSSETHSHFPASSVISLHCFICLYFAITFFFYLIFFCYTPLLIYLLILVIKLLAIPFSSFIHRTTINLFHLLSFSFIFHYLLLSVQIYELRYTCFYKHPFSLQITTTSYNLEALPSCIMQTSQYLRT